MPRLSDPEILKLHRRSLLNCCVPIQRLQQPSVVQQLRVADNVLIYNLTTGELEPVIKSDAQIDPTLRDGSLDRCIVLPWHPQQLGMGREFTISNIHRIRSGENYEPPVRDPEVERQLRGQ